MKKILVMFGLTLLSFKGMTQLNELEVRQMTQTASEEQLVVEASRMLQENYFFLAEIVVDRLLQINPSSPNYNYRKGFIILDSRQDWFTAMPYFNKALVDIDPNFDMYSANETSAPTDVYFHIARCYHLDEQIDKAKEYYSKFIASSNKKSELIQNAKVRLLQCENAIFNLNNPKKSIVKNIGNVVNGVYPDYSPVISLDGTSLYFTSRRQWADQSTDNYKDPQLNQYPEDIYVSYGDLNANWTAPERLSFCDGKLNEATVTISADERRVYTYEDRTGFGDIYFSDFRNNQFTDLTILGYKNLNTTYWETHCTVTPDGQNMYFVSDRPGGFGGRDIYRTVKLPNGEWSEPVNLGPIINTAYDEDSPFIAIDNKTLYFSSNGPNSMGGFDIFFSIRDENNIWSNSVNLGYPINSTGDDIFYTTTADGHYGYLSSFRKNGFGEKDIYQIENAFLQVNNVAVLKGRISTSDGSKLPESVYATIKCLNCDDTRENNLLPRLRDGSLMYSLTPCRSYEIAFYYDSLTKIAYKETFETACSKGYEEIYKEVLLNVAKKRIIPVRHYTLDGIVSDKTNGNTLEGAKVEFLNPTTQESYETLITDKAGDFNSMMLKNKMFGDSIYYRVRVSKDGFIAQTFDFKTTLSEDTALHLSYILEKLEIGIDLAKTFDLNPIYFDLDKSNIRPDAKIELDKIVKIMNDNPTLVVELGSHTDCRATIQYNLSLSDRRAKASASYIKGRISNPKRIYGKGYGESNLVNECGCEGELKSTCSEEEHQANRRTEFRVVKN
ncbi:MAG: OmpA family protein [Crocinitomicaceae bacterium]|nr:OmpA family protein [Crocinitomicaceae bacterium]